MLNGVPMSMRLFQVRENCPYLTRYLWLPLQESCGYVTQKCDLLGGLSVESSLLYAANISLGRKVSSYVKQTRVKQVG